MKLEILISILLTVIVAGCAKEPDKVPAPKPPDARAAAQAKDEKAQEFTFTATNEVVDVEDIEVKDASKAVFADFNLDGYQDLAVIDKGEDGDGNEVAVYIRKPETKGTALSEDGKTLGPLKKLYYKGGTIRRVAEGAIIGIASRKRKNFTDLILLVAHPGHPNELIQYRNEGDRFAKVY